MQYRECVTTGAAGAQTCRSLGHHLLHPLILRLLVICAPTDFENPENRLHTHPHPQIQIPNAIPAIIVEWRVEKKFKKTINVEGGNVQGGLNFLAKSISVASRLLER